jgi:hypothetical protein
MRSQDLNPSCRTNAGPYGVVKYIDGEGRSCELNVPKTDGYQDVAENNRKLHMTV